MKRSILLFVGLLFTGTVFCQSVVNDSLVMRKLFDHALTDQQAYTNLVKLCSEAPARLSGSANYEKAVEITRTMLIEAGADTVYLQEVWIPHWERGAADTAWMIAGDKKIGVHITALGGSIATSGGGLEASIVEVSSIEALEKLGEEKIKGKIVFFNKPMDPKYVDTFSAYGGCASLRLYGATEAAKFGAAGVIVRSLTLNKDNHPHTGVMIYKSEDKIPAAAISTNDADYLSKLLIKNPALKLHLTLGCKNYPDMRSFNVVGEIKGSEFPQEVIAFGGHLDSWDNSQGAHDDGAGCVQGIDVIRLFKTAGIKPQRTIRCVLWANEENGARGADGYAAIAREKNETHLVAIESDRGGFTPRGFTIDGQEKPKTAAYERLQSWAPLFSPYLVHIFEYGGSGVDVSRLKDQGPALLGFVPDSQRYFDVHHAETDTIEQVNPRELELGAATIASVVYLFDRYGLY